EQKTRSSGYRPELLSRISLYLKLRCAALTIPLFLLLVLRRILLVRIHISLLLLPGLPSLAGLSALLALTVLALLTGLLVLPLAVLPTLLFVHIICHVYSSIVCRARLGALLRDLLASVN
ncbi:MAG: hypothetical protein WA198_10805, partial [Candidatus Sulfotelmatobacter sp.]